MLERGRVVLPYGEQGDAGRRASGLEEGEFLVDRLSVTYP